MTEVSKKILVQGEMFAISQGIKCEGDLECHWCSAPCTREYLHDDPPPIAFYKSVSTARRVSSHYVCKGCLAFRRNRTTVRFLNGGFKDGQAPMDHSWYFCDTGAWTLCPADTRKLYQTLLNPPLRFVLALLVNGPVSSGVLLKEGMKNHLQLMIVNDCKEILGDTLLWYTINGVKHAYTVYELLEGLKSGISDGKEPGTRTLLELLGLDPEMLRKEEKGDAGRPLMNPKTPKKTVITVGTN